MTVHQSHEFSEDKQADAESIFASHGFDIIDFDIRDEEQCPAGDSANMLCRKVMVPRRSNGKSAVYAAGQGAAWHADPKAIWRPECSASARFSATLPLCTCFPQH